MVSIRAYLPSFAAQSQLLPHPVTAALPSLRQHTVTQLGIHGLEASSVDSDYSTRKEC